jgi:hypothetical protein
MANEDGEGASQVVLQSQNTFGMKDVGDYPHERVFRIAWFTCDSAHETGTHQ